MGGQRAHRMRSTVLILAVHIVSRIFASLTANNRIKQATIIFHSFVFGSQSKDNNLVFKFEEWSATAPTAVIYSSYSGCAYRYTEFVSLTTRK